RQCKTGPPKRRPGHNLLRRLRDFKTDVLRFARDFAVPFTNNMAEQDIRMMKVRMKVSGGFRSRKGADVFAAVRSIISTARKQKWNIIDTLSALPQDLINALRPAV
ncbi:MAG: transposase, partial [Pseudomonadota bacterium]